MNLPKVELSDADKMKIIDSLREAMKEANLPVKTVAIVCGVKPPTVSGWLKGNRIPLEKLEKLKSILDIPEEVIGLIEKSHQRIEESKGEAESEPELVANGRSFSENYDLCRDDPATIMSLQNMEEGGHCLSENLGGKTVYQQDNSNECNEKEYLPKKEPSFVEMVMLGLAVAFLGLYMGLDTLGEKGICAYECLSCLEVLGIMKIREYKKGLTRKPKRKICTT